MIVPVPAMGEVVCAARPIWPPHLGMTSRPRWRNRTVEASAYGCSDFGRASAAADYPGDQDRAAPISGVLVTAAGAGSRWPGPGVVVAAAQTAAGAPVGAVRPSRTVTAPGTPAPTSSPRLTTGLSPQLGDEARTGTSWNGGSAANGGHGPVGEICRNLLPWPGRGSGERGRDGDRTGTTHRVGVQPPQLPR